MKKMFEFIKNFIANNFLKGEDALQSSKPANIIAFFVVALVLTSLLSVRYYLYQNIISNGIAEKTIYAKNSFEVVDKQRTELIKREVANKIRPVVTPVEGDYIKDDLQHVMDEIERIKKEGKSYQTKQKELFNLLEISDVELKNKAVAYILSSSDTNLSTTFTNTKYILNELLNLGVFDADISNILTDAFIEKRLEYKVKKSQFPLIIGLVEHSVIPNLIIDEYATEVARKNAKSAVKPYVVTFKKGDKILTAGEKVTQLKKDALKSSGYNAYELNKLGVFGIFALVCLTMYLLILYLRKYETRFFNPRYMFFIALSSIILVYVCIVVASSIHISDYLMPFVAFTTILAIFTSPILSFLVTILLIAILTATLFLSSQLVYTFMCISLFSSYLVSMMSYTKRFDIIWCGFQIGLTMALAMLYMLFFEYQSDAFNILFQLHNQNPFLGLVSGLISSMIAMFLIPIIEKAFKIVSPYALIELADQNQELLSKLRSTAPGTFHHSLMVANLCEEAACAIGANSILARVGAFYHDIGKLQRPLFFIENQSYFGVENPHTTLTPRQSKMVITLHAKDGVEIAKKHGLPDVVIDFIKEHHGECLAGHFYTKAVEEEGEENVSESQFRYPGPKPRTKETAILMLADALESAVRSLKNPSQDEIDAMLNKIFTERLNDGQLSDSPLTLKDIKIIAMTFTKILRGMRHERIKYQEKIVDEISDNSDNASEDSYGSYKKRSRIAKSQDDEFERKLRKFQQKSDKGNDNV